jgi:mRNA-degrading endonuclease toxin of MazEF toxin-antitoxin module
MPETGLEPANPAREVDFKSTALTSFATPATVLGSLAIEPLAALVLSTIIVACKKSTKSYDVLVTLRASRPRKNCSANRQSLPHGRQIENMPKPEEFASEVLWQLAVLRAEIKLLTDDINALKTGKVGLIVQKTRLAKKQAWATEIYRKSAGVVGLKDPSVHPPSSDILEDDQNLE